MLGRVLARKGVPVLFIDADPQASLTAFLGVEIQEGRPTLLDVITQPASKVPLYTAIHEVPNEENLFLIPANNFLEGANHFLAASPISIRVLRDRLHQVGEDDDDKVVNNFGVIIVDPPPERSHLALTSMGCADFWVIPAEANVKGVQSLQRTKELVESYQSVTQGKLLGCIPFRAKWVGLNPTGQTKESMGVMASIMGEDQMLPHILESEIYKTAINEQVLPRDLGKPELEYPVDRIVELIKDFLGEYTNVVSEEAA
ncbi:ParA family protein [Lyngbya confervoides BDU141951]|uniref:ParA family protein n=2 Tax=Lyngbya TaxID=28073 RepID=A0ABD4T8Z4_9CYAN|nr:ParA family protein [Lyngbya confervoides BDU141951]